MVPSQAAHSVRRSPRAPWTIPVAEFHQETLKTLRARTDLITPLPLKGRRKISLVEISLNSASHDIHPYVVSRLLEGMGYYTVMGFSINLSGRQYSRLGLRSPPHVSRFLSLSL